MRHAMLALFGLLSASGAMMVGTGSAVAHDFPYCAQGQELGIPGDCSYPSYEACLASASGRGLSCNINPRVAFQEQNQPQYQPDPPRRGRRNPY